MPIFPPTDKFPEPPLWATYAPSRSSSKAFKMHSTLGLVKTSVNGLMEWHGFKGVWVYEWCDDEELGAGWVERFHVAPGADKNTHPLWQTKQKPKKRLTAVPQHTIDKTIASILKSAT